MMLPVTIQPTKTHLATLIFLHGLGDTGNGWAPVMRFMSRMLPHFRFVLPHAPAQPVTLNGGMSMPAWYDIYSLSEKEAVVDWKGISKSADYVRMLVREEQKDNKKVFIGGFSQGGVIALTAGLGLTSDGSSSVLPHGIVALSAYLPPGTKLRALDSTTCSSIPVFMGHGRDDQVVQCKWGEGASKQLQSHGLTNVQFHSYPAMQHEASDQEIDDIIRFIDDIMKVEHDEV